MFEQEKKLEDYQKEHNMIDKKRFEKMSYLERVQLYNNNPEEYRRLTHQGTAPKRSSSHNCSSQTRR